MASNYDKLKQFHQKFGVVQGMPGHVIANDRVILRTRLIVEEFAELVEAMQMKDYPAIAKELADLLYVVYGTAVEYGIPMDEVFEAVHQSNMSKTGSRDAGGKITKGENYEPPDILKVLTEVFNRRR